MDGRERVKAIENAIEVFNNEIFQCYNAPEAFKSELINNNFIKNFKLFTFYFDSIRIFHIFAFTGLYPFPLCWRSATVAHTVQHQKQL